MKMSIIIVAVLFLSVLSSVHANEFELEMNENEHEEHYRAKRAVDLPTLRRLMNNIAMSEYYRLRGLEVLGTIGGGGSGNRLTSAQAADDAVAAPTKSQSLFDFPGRNKEFAQFFSALNARRRYSRRG